MTASRPLVRRVRRLALLVATAAAIAAVRDRLIGSVEQREGDRLGLDGR